MRQALKADYEVVGAADGYEAFTKILKERQEFDLIVTDLRMPNISGITLAENLPKDIPIIVISAYLQRPSFKEAMKRIHPVAVLEKPFKLSAIRKAIEDTLGRKASPADSRAEMDAAGSNAEPGPLETGAAPEPPKAELTSAPEGSAPAGR